MMIEETVLNYLSDALDAPVCMEVPAEPPGRFVVVEKTGSSRTDHICRAVIAVQSYGESLLEAARLNERVKQVMEGLDELDEIAAVRLNTDCNFTDPSTKRYRYQAVFDVTHY